MHAHVQSDLKPADLESAYLAFLEEAIRLRGLYADRISLLIGLETDYITDLDLSHTSQLLNRRTDIDYIVGSVHHVNGVSIDFDRPTWIRAILTVVDGKHGSTMDVSPNSGTVSLPEVEGAGGIPPMEDLRIFLLAYFDAQYDMLVRLQPEVMGHIDLCLLWTPEISLQGEGMEPVWDKVRRNVEYVVSYGGLFEANAAAIRKGWKSSYPNPDILKVGGSDSVTSELTLQLIMELGGRLCLSDDSHGVSYVGLNYLKMKQYLVDQGVNAVWYLVPTSSALEADVKIGRGRVSARQLDDWAGHPFWGKLALAQKSA